MSIRGPATKANGLVIACSLRWSLVAIRLHSPARAASPRKRPRDKNGNGAAVGGVVVCRRQMRRSPPFGRAWHSQIPFDKLFGQRDKKFVASAMKFSRRRGQIGPWHGGPA